MIGYIVDENGFLKGTHICQKNPMAKDGDENQYLMPSNVIIVQPPQEVPPEGKTYMFNGTSWQEVDDHAYLEMLAKQKDEADRIAASLALEQESLQETARLNQIAEENRIQAEIAQQARIQKLTSAKVKLLALGLNEDEINAMIGI
jgi:hypothetical protein